MIQYHIPLSNYVIQQLSSHSKSFLCTELLSSGMLTFTQLFQYLTRYSMMGSRYSCRSALHTFCSFSVQFRIRIFCSEMNRYANDDKLFWTIYMKTGSNTTTMFYRWDKVMSRHDVSRLNSTGITLVQKTFFSTIFWVVCVIFSKLEKLVEVLFLDSGGSLFAAPGTIFIHCFPPLLWSSLCIKSDWTFSNLF